MSLLKKINTAFSDPNGPGVMITCNPLHSTTGPIYMDGSATILRENGTWELFNPPGDKVQFGFFWNPDVNQEVVSCGFALDAASSYRIDCTQFSNPSATECKTKGKQDRCGYCFDLGSSYTASCGGIGLPTLCKPPSSPAPWPNRGAPDKNCIQTIMRTIDNKRTGINEFVFIPDYETYPRPDGLPKSFPLEEGTVLDIMKKNNIPAPSGLAFIYDISLQNGTNILEYNKTQEMIQNYLNKFVKELPVLVMELDTQAYKEKRSARFPPNFKTLIPLGQLISYLKTVRLPPNYEKMLEQQYMYY